MKSLFQKFVVAVNGSVQSIHAAMYGILMAKQYGCKMKAVFVVDVSTLKQLEMSKFFLKEESKRYKQRLEDDGTRYLSYVSGLAEQKGVKIETELRIGAVWSEIIKASDEYGADLVVLGGKEHSATQFGSALYHDRTSATNSEIIGSASCNVLVVREPEMDKLFKFS